MKTRGHHLSLQGLKLEPPYSSYCPQSPHPQLIVIITLIRPPYPNPAPPSLYMPLHFLVTSYLPPEPGIPATSLLGPKLNSPAFFPTSFLKKPCAQTAFAQCTPHMCLCWSPCSCFIQNVFFPSAVSVHLPGLKHYHTMPFLSLLYSAQQKLTSAFIGLVQFFFYMCTVCRILGR